MQFDQAHRNALQDILRWRRDVRHFKSDPISDASLLHLKDAMDMAPSVGNARPWRVIQVKSDSLRLRIIENFETANSQAAKVYQNDRLKKYNTLKLAGLRTAPVHLAIFTDQSPTKGHGLGRQTMPEMLNYSTVTAIHTLWLAARAANIGVGWVSILNPDEVTKALNTPENWTFTGYLCLGYAASADDTPLLHKNDWQKNTQTQWQEM